MTWYPDWVVALDDTAKDKPNANVTPRNAQDAIREIQELTEERDRLRRIQQAAQSLVGAWENDEKVDPAFDDLRRYLNEGES